MTTATELGTVARNSVPTAPKVAVLTYDCRGEIMTREFPCALKAKRWYEAFIENSSNTNADGYVAYVRTASKAWRYFVTWNCACGWERI